MLALLLSLPIPALPDLPEEPRLSTPSATWEAPLLSPSGDCLVTGSWLLDLRRERIVAHLPGFGGEGRAHFSTDGKRCLLWSPSGGLVLLDAMTGEELGRRAGSTERSVWTRASAGLERVVQRSTEGTTVLDGSTLEVIADWPGRSYRYVAFSEDGGLLVLVSGKGLWLWTGEDEPRALDVPAELGYVDPWLVEEDSCLLVRAHDPSGGGSMRLLRIDLASGRVQADVVIPNRAVLGGVDDGLGVLALAAQWYNSDLGPGRVEVRRLGNLELLRGYPGEINAYLFEGTGRLLIGEADSPTRAVDPLSGEVLWRRGVPLEARQLRSGPRPSMPDGAVIVPWFGPGGRLLGTDVVTGQDAELWSMPLQPIALGRAPSGDLWCAYSAGRLERLNPRTLTVLASQDLGEVLDRVVAAGPRLVCTTVSREAVVVGLEDLEVVGRAACGRGLAASGRGGRVLLYGAGEEQARLWTPDTGELEELAVRVGRGAAVSEDGWAVVLLEGGDVRLLHGGEVRPVEIPAGHYPTVPVVDADGRWAFIGCGVEMGESKNTGLRAVLLEGPRLARRRELTLEGAFIFGGEFRRVALSADGSRLAFTTGNWLVSGIWDTTTWQQCWKKESDGGNGGWTDTVLSRDGARFAQWGSLQSARFYEGPQLVHELSDWAARHLVPGENGAPPAWLSASRLYLGVPGARERVERILWPDSEVVLRVDATGERLTGGEREELVRVRGE